MLKVNKQTTQKTNKMNKVTKIGIIAAIAILVAGGIVFAYRSKNESSKTPDATPVSQQSNPNINLEPATDQEKQATEQHKNDLAQQTPPNTNTTPSGQKKQVSVVITSATSTSLNAYISGVLEDSGTCTLTLTRGSQTVTKSSPGFGNVNTTNCTPINYDTLSTGTWTATLTYTSPTAEGKSQTTIEAP